MSSARKRSRKPKDKNAPKRPLSAYFIFARENRPRMKVENPELKNNDITKKISKEWKDIDKDKKKEYQKQADELKKKYIEEYDEYKQTVQYKQYTEKLKEWKSHQNDIGKNKKNAPQKQSTSNIFESNQNIKNKINSFFERYRDRLRKSKYPREAVSNQYGWGLEKGSEWILKLMKSDINAAIYASVCLVKFKPNIGMMDFSMGGPFYEISQFMDVIDKLIKKKQISSASIKPLYKALLSFHKTWDDYAMGQDIKATIDKIQTKWSF